jgi:hypothetical protein
LRGTQPLSLESIGQSPAVSKDKPQPPEHVCTFFDHNSPSLETIF